MKGLILLDGPDCGGKSTLALALKEQVERCGGRAVVRHLGKPDRGTCWEVHSQALLANIQEAFERDTVVLMDRHFMSEGVYGSIYRGGSEYPYAMRHLDRLLHRFQAVRVICSPPLEVVTKAHAKARQERHEEYTDISLVAQRYLDLWEGVGDKATAETDYLAQLAHLGRVQDTFGWLCYDWSSEDVLEAAKRIVNTLAEQLVLGQHAGFDVFNTRHYFTGFPHQQAVLLVGDKVSTANSLMVPFYANSGSSLYLAKALQACCVDESRLVVVNANSGTPAGASYTLQLLASSCGRVIALGREAEKTLLKAQVRYHAYVRHPQHARRFDHHNTSYAKELKEAFNGWAGALQ